MRQKLRPDISSFTSIIIAATETFFYMRSTVSSPRESTGPHWTRTLPVSRAELPGYSVRTPWHQAKRKLREDAEHKNQHDQNPDGRGRKPAYRNCSDIPLGWLPVHRFDHLQIEV